MNNSESRLRSEQDILSRLENVKRLIEMETTLMTAEGAKKYAHYYMVDRDGQRLGSGVDDMIHDLRENIQLQLLSIVALCYGDNPDVGEPCPMLEWKSSNTEEHSEDKFRDMWQECLMWNA